ncbi:glycoside hydrolase family protein [Aspergillus lucknowensis]|uniref:Asl1-like glycosyl hydrolase catalytic domain-containing protein n=1 Tax=Aspergillus lucknowensis TaxID=176173 RepID=A0ABR4LYE5_9EURO
MASLLLTTVLASTTLGQATGKRGLAYNNDNPSKDAVYANLFKGNEKVSWAYDWGYPAWNLDPSFEFVPMLWGLPSGAAGEWTDAVQTPGVVNILGFNEPDLTYDASSNILPADAAAGYIEYIQPFAGTVRIGSPSVLWNNEGPSSGGPYNSTVWTEFFLGNCTGCQLDFLAIHWYQDCFAADGQKGADWFIGNVTNAHETLDLPIWVTEFECYGEEDEQIAFLEEVLPWMDGQEYVERYAYFGAFPKYLINEAGDGLSDLGRAYATI